ncbi:GNAT family N-acetyltransferase [Thalassotalea crassostreae]|uniref:GNAT family N-acetyltransferase n=1 Tax=Thalassotalea crassostreae TaxID=1763536 RepID=UPI000ADA5644|nr:GNAT family N-acetyltransferase [Thalassotalea crassostreae]
MSEYIAHFVTSINDIDEDSWNTLFSSSYPFTKHGFLSALEDSHVVSKETGWIAQHLLIYKKEKENSNQNSIQLNPQSQLLNLKHQKSLVAAMPAYIKLHSYGEYMFDWSWADAFLAKGIEYYPKLVSSVPFTPATGQRFAVANSELENYNQLIKLMVNACKEIAHRVSLSNMQWLFVDKQGSLELANEDTLQRTDIQYHWFNRGYANFDDFLATLKSRKRKNISKERAQVHNNGICFSWLSGEQISSLDWQQFFQFYQLTYMRRSGHQGYLNLSFFQNLPAKISEQVLLLKATKDDRVVGCALYFKSDTHLYGRYWGSTQEFDFLHFEACYYQGIEYCIKHGLQVFDAGAQGEHKLLRGFEPVVNYGNYLFFEQTYKQSIAQFLRQETEHHKEYLKNAKNYLPYKHSE